MGSQRDIYYGDSAGGNVGIGTTMPQEKLHVVGGIRLSQYRNLSQLLPGMISFHDIGGDFDFSAPIPSFKAEAEVELNKIESFSNIDLDKWQEENCFLYDGISFCWSFDDIDPVDFDTCIYEHEGQEIII